MGLIDAAILLCGLPLRDPADVARVIAGLARGARSGKRSA
jgi:hypothetical protein